MWALALTHGVWVGTDTGSAYALLAYGLSAAAVAGTAWWRWFEVVPKQVQRSRPTAVEPAPAPRLARPDAQRERQAA